VPDQQGIPFARLPDGVAIQTWVGWLQGSADAGVAVAVTEAAASRPLAATIRATVVVRILRNDSFISYFIFFISPDPPT
jgi:hypothetical protein